MVVSAAVVLAAGAGTRLGGVAKALLRSNDRTFLEHIVDRARGDDPIIVVVGPPFGDAVAEHARSLGAQIVGNPDPSRGMASSIALGFAALASSTADHAWLWPVDHPFVTRHTLEALERELGVHDVARPVYQGRGGHPPLIRRARWQDLASCDQIEGGARAVISKLDVVDVVVDDPGVVRDVDTPEDRQALT